MARQHTAILTAFLAVILSTQVFSSERASAARTAELRYRLVEVFRVLPDGQRESLLPVSMNDRGEVLVTGSLRDASNDPPWIRPGRRAFIWRGGRVVSELVSPDSSLPDLEVNRINNRSEVVGSRVLYDIGYTLRQAIVWRHGRFTELTSLPGPDALWSYAFAINDWGVVGGATVDNDIDVYATPYRWYRGRSTRVPIDPALSASVRDINNLGQVIGDSRPGPHQPYEGPYGGFIADRKGPVRFLESLPGSERLTAVAINDRGQVIGNAGNRAALWEDGTALDLGTLPGASSTSAVAINIFSTVVGVVTYASGDTTAVIWRDGELRDLNEMIAADDPNASGVHLVSVSDINNRGWIAARGTDASRPGGQYTYLLIPAWKHRH
jgi:uncharacterized membrane protein